MVGTPEFTTITRVFCMDIDWALSVCAALLVKTGGVVPASRESTGVHPLACTCTALTIDRSSPDVGDNTSALVASNSGT